MTDLRSRRRLELSQEIHEVALDLFEQQGLRGTTVQQIAERVGISARTFFRHFTSKEQAALPGQQRLVASISELDLRGLSLSEALRTLETATQAHLDESLDQELRTQRRVALLLTREPELRAAAGVQDQELTALLVETLATQIPGADATERQVVAEIAVAAWRTAWQRWGELAINDQPGDPAGFYRTAVATRRSLV